MHTKFKRSVQMMLSFLFVLLMPITAFAEETNEDVESFKVIHTNDIHAAIKDFPNFKTFLDAERAEGPVLYLNAGDNFSGAPIVDYFQGEPMIKLLNLLEVDAMTIGNHEFDYGQEHFEARRQQSNFPWLAANMEIVDSSIPITAWTAQNEYKIFDVNGLKVGVVGLVEAPPATKLSGIKGINFHPYAETMKKYKFLRDEVDVLIALTHIGVRDDEQLAQEVDFFDLIVGGHSHTTLPEPLVVNGTPIVQAGGKMKNVGEVTVEVNSTDKTVNVEGRLLSVKDTIKNYEPNQEAQAIIDEYQKAADDKLNVRIGSTKNKLDRDNRWEQDSSMGNMITDALREFGGTEIAITNNGGLRDSIEAGDITKSDIFRVDPFDNEVAILSVPGSVLKEIIEFSFHRADEKFGYTITDISSSGLTYTIYYDGPQGKDTPREDRKFKAADLLVNGEPVEDDRLYTVTTNAFLADGGDGYSMFEKANWDKDTYHGKVTEAIIDYIESFEAKNQSLDYAYTEGRNVIKHISERPEEKPAPKPDSGSNEDSSTKPNKKPSAKDEIKKGTVEKKAAKKDKKSLLPKAGEMIKNNAGLVLILVGTGGAIIYFTRKKDEVK